MLQSIKKLMFMALLFAITSTATFATTVDEWDGTTFASAFASGTGTSSNPYVINTGPQFAYFIKSIGNGTTYSGKYIQLGNNIDLNSNLLPTTGDFYGDFNGNNHQLQNCVFTSEGYMFRNVYGVIRNLGLKSHFNKHYSSLTYSVQSNGLIFNCDHVFTGGKGDFNYSSAFAYQNYGHIVYCHAEGQATGWHWTGSSDNGHEIIQGGLVYTNQSSGVILNCLSDIKSYYDGYKGNSYSTVADYHFLYKVNLGSLYNDVETDDTQKTYWNTWKSNHSTYSYNQSFDTTTVIKTVTFHDSMGFYATTTQQVNKGSAIGTLPVPEYDCTFDGWKVGTSFIYSSYIVNSDITVEAAWTQRIKQQPTFENPEFIVEDPDHASYQWYKGFPTTITYDDWASSNTGNSTTDSKTYSIVAKKGNVLSFDWSVSSETYDRLSVDIGYTSLVYKSGEESGSYEYIIPSDGTYTLKVSYTKDSSGSAGTDNASVTNIQLLDLQSVREAIANQTSNVFSLPAYRKGENFFCIATYSNSNTELCSEVITTPGAAPDTDITDIANTIYFENAEALKGSEVTLSVKMKNTIEPTGFQFDLYLPEGVSVVQDADGFCDVALSTERTTTAKTNTFDSAIQHDGALRVLAASTKNYVFSGNDGEVCTIKLMVDESLEPGDYPLLLKNIEMTNNAGGTWSTEHIKRTLTVVDYTIGDVNADTKINVGDFSAIASHIMGDTPAGFVEMAADVNNDSKINVGDLSGLVTIIMNGGEAQSLASARRAKSISATDVSELDNVIYPSAFTVAPGADAELVFNMKNNFNATGFQFDFTLPEGMYVPEDEDGFLEATLSTIRTTTKKTNTFECGQVGNNTYRILVASTRNYEYEGNDGEVVRVSIHADESMSEGSYALNLTDITLTDAHGATYDTDRLVAELTVAKENTPAPDVALTDGEDYTNNVKKNCKSLTYTRTFSSSNVNHWVALYVPISIDVEAYADKFDVAQIYAFCSTVDTNGDGSVDADDENFLFVQPKKTGCTVANVPYVIRPKAAGECVINSADNVLYPAENGEVTFSTSTDLFTVRGLYEPFTVTAGDNNYYVSGTGALNIRTEGSTTVKANRWIMHRDMRDYGSSIANGKSSQASYRIVALGEDMDEATAIKIIEGERPQQSNDMFTLDGRKVQDASSLKRGIYIMNGKKVWR